MLRMKSGPLGIRAPMLRAKSVPVADSLAGWLLCSWRAASVPVADFVLCAAQQRESWDQLPFAEPETA